MDTQDETREVGVEVAGPCPVTHGQRNEPAALRHRRLLTREEVQALLALNEDQVKFLIGTRQITRIRIAGEERFDSRDIDGLIDAYKATALRRAQ